MVLNNPIGSEVERSLSRSRQRMRVLVMLSSVGEAHPGQLARLCSISINRLKWIMFGHHPAYAPELSLISLQLAELVFTPHGRVYRITERGRRKARSVMASVVRFGRKVDRL